ncbi:MAG: hypothetical protein LBS55_09735 [Prevotellaceae bacterium]|jgi:hypothetical protein|nr:hypothetical protein [Prevotellaceae bacterium]
MLIDFYHALETFGERGRNYHDEFNIFLEKKTKDIDLYIKWCEERSREFYHNTMLPYDLRQFLKGSYLSDLSDIFEWWHGNEEKTLKFKKVYAETIDYVKKTLDDGILNVVGIIGEKSLEDKIEGFRYYGLITIYSELPNSLKNNNILKQAIIDSYIKDNHSRRKHLDRRYKILPDEFKENKEIIRSTILDAYFDGDEGRSIFESVKVYLLNDLELLTKALTIAVERYIDLELKFFKDVIDNGIMNIKIALLAVRNVQIMDVIDLFEIFPLEIQCEKAVILEVLNRMENNKGSIIKLFMLFPKDILDEEILLKALGLMGKNAISLYRLFPKEIQNNTEIIISTILTVIHNSSRLEKIVDVSRQTHQSDTSWWAYDDNTLVYETIVDQEEVSHVKVVYDIDCILESLNYLTNDNKKIIFKYLEKNLFELYLKIKQKNGA